jgi:uncharacterized protein (TIGR02679 family)
MDPGRHPAHHHREHHPQAASTPVAVTTGIDSSSASQASAMPGPHRHAPQSRPCGSRPTTRAWTFVTENPSVASAAADLAATGAPVSLLCTSGTPSAVEVAAIARLAEDGWQVGLRADFDAAGIAHVAAVLRAAPSSYLWRMGAGDYEESLGVGGVRVPLTQVPDTPWEPALASAMRARGLAAFEEALLPDLLADLRLGEPP